MANVLVIADMEIEYCAIQECSDQTEQSYIYRNAALEGIAFNQVIE